MGLSLPHGSPRARAGPLLNVWRSAMPPLAGCTFLPVDTDGSVGPSRVKQKVERYVVIFGGCSEGQRLSCGLRGLL